MILYSCDEFKFGSITDDDLIGDKCYMASGQPGTPLATCLSGNVVAAWAAGGEVRVYSIRDINLPLHAWARMYVIYILVCVHVFVCLHSMLTHFVYFINNIIIV